MTRCLTMLECGSIQSYIFASNRLSEAIGGSWLVAQATTDLLKQVLKDCLDPAKLRLDWKDSSELEILDNPGLQAEIWYSGGGNAVLIFDSLETAKRVTGYLSSQLLAIAPGLNLLAAHEALEENNKHSLSKALEEALEKQAKLKERAWAGQKREGLSITRECATTGLAATIGYRSQGEESWISAGAAARRAAASAANDDLKERYHKILIKDGEYKYKFPLDLDDLGNQEGQSQIAIVHIDGNSIGKRLTDLLGKSLLNQELARKVREFSKSIENAAQKAFRQTLADLRASLSPLQEKENGLQLTRIAKSNSFYFPLRPLIVGGDDLTFVCEGRLGLSLAARYLEYFSKEKDSEEKELSACAGVVIARSHFPLARAYNLAEALCGKAKSKIRESQRYEEGTSWLDFQIIFSGVTGKLDQVREEAMELYWRPWRVVDKRSRDRQSWENFKDIVNDLTDKWPRSQVKSLRENLAGGEEATEVFQSQAALRKHYLHSSVAKYISLNGWVKVEEEGQTISKTILYDPIEAMDFYLELGKAGGNDANPA